MQKQPLSRLIRAKRVLSNPKRRREDLRRPRTTVLPPFMTEKLRRYIHELEDITLGLTAENKIWSINLRLYTSLFYYSYLL